MWAALAARLLPMVLEGGGAAAAEGKGMSGVLSAAQGFGGGGGQKQSAPSTGASQGAGASPMYTGTY